MATTSTVDRARVRLIGTTGLVLDNIASADPDSEIFREIKAITDKKEMTAEDRQRKDWLAYHGALYVDGDRVMLPWANILRALRSGANLVGGAMLSGKAASGIASAATDFEIEHDGPKPDRLYDDPRFRLSKMVNKNPSGKKAMIMTVRPIFPQWEVNFGLTVLNEVIGWDQFKRVFEMTGEAVGVGNARRLGYGRFATEITKA